MSIKVIVDGVFLMVVDLTSMVADWCCWLCKCQGAAMMCLIVVLLLQHSSRDSLNLKRQHGHRNRNTLSYIDRQSAPITVPQRRRQGKGFERISDGTPRNSRTVPGLVD